MAIQRRRTVLDPMKDRWYYAAPLQELDRLELNVLLAGFQRHCFRPVKQFNGYWLFTSDPRHQTDSRQAATRGWKYYWKRLGVNFLTRSQFLWEVEQAVLDENERLGIRYAYKGDDAPEVWWTRR